MIQRKTKIVCTIGPASSDEKTIRAMVRAGLDIARLNFSHGAPEEHKKRFQIIQKIAVGEKKQVAIMADLQGPKIRLGSFRENPVYLKAKSQFILTTRNITGTREVASCTYKGLSHDVKKGDHIFLNDGLVKLAVQRVSGADIYTRVIEGGTISDHKGINLPGVTLSTSGITIKDTRDIAFAVKMGADYIALSFVRSATDLIKAKRLIKNAGGDTPVVAKIEKHEAITNLEEIINIADGVMVARGDLGVEMPLEDVPMLQKKIISLAVARHKPVITATQMLESMIENPRPTRAEVSDVANAILDGTDAVMLSAETAVGKNPVAAVRTMSNIAVATEAAFTERPNTVSDEKTMPVSDSVAQAACFLAERLGANVIVAFTASGFTARMISSFRPHCRILGVTPLERISRRMALYHGVYPVKGQAVKNIDHMIEHAVEQACAIGLIRRGDLVVITAGAPIGVTGTTNLIKVHVA